MRKAQQEEILDFIKNLYKAHDEIKDKLNQGKWTVAQNMLSECQEFAQNLGEIIENAEGGGHITVSYIEDYCEILFHIYEEIGSLQINENKIGKTLKKTLLRIENSVKNDINVRKEIVFFPYKASMWDSLESIYLAAKEDPNCDAYCVPIPYYDLNPDHSFGQMHYEGREYPQNIEVIDWQAYKFEERRPDEIYIHNAYDDWNLVTSIHPRFYSKNLKKYTDKLIYLPYFVLGKINVDDQDVVESRKHFCFLPGIINADLVIVESEDIKRMYVNEFVKAAKESGLTGKYLERKYLEQKIQGLGSPKYDRVLRTKRKKVEVPANWLKIIKKPDGTKKRIVFYNTGISALLQDNEKWIDKIEDSIQIFKECQNSVALLWRPHPLIENTMKSMRPQLYEKYMKIKNQYIEDGWGIYDDTADIDRAIAISDAYYGDSSSVVYMYQQTGKPIMLQNMDVINRRNETVMRKESDNEHRERGM